MAGRTARYAANRDQLVPGMITTFRTPLEAACSFATFHCALKQRRFMIHTGKVTDTDTFRIGAIGDIHSEDIRRLLAATGGVCDEMGLTP